MRVGLLGPLELEAGSLALGPRDRSVLAALAMRRGQWMAADALADALWPDRPPASWVKVVQGCVSRLRRVLGAESIETSPSGYRLRPEWVDLDVVELEDLVARAGPGWPKVRPSAPWPASRRRSGCGAAGRWPSWRSGRRPSWRRRG